MVTTSFGSAAVTASYTDNWVQDSISMPTTTRAAANGGKYCLITGLLGYVSGRGASRSIVLSLGSANTSSFSRAAAGSASSTGYVGTDLVLTTGGSATFKIDGNGSFYFGRASSGSGATDSYGTSYPPLGGAIRYCISPTAPLTPLIQAVPGDPTAAVLEWSAPSSNGDSSITGYRLQWWYEDDPGTVTTVDLGNVLTYDFTGLTPGKTIVVKVAAKNAVTNAAGTTSVYSTTTSLALASGGHVYDGAALVPGTVKVWNGTELVLASSVKIWDGSALVPAV